MRLALLVAAFAALAAPGASAAKVRGWYCFLGFDAAERSVEACERTKKQCEADLAKHDLQNPTKCFHARKAAAFTATHKDGRSETLAVPEMDACRFIRESVQAEQDVASVSECAMRR